MMYADIESQNNMTKQAKIKLPSISKIWMYFENRSKVYPIYNLEKVVVHLSPVHTHTAEYNVNHATCPRIN